MSDNYTEYKIIRINTTMNELFVKFIHPNLPDYFCRRGWDGEMDETMLAGMLNLMQAEANTFAKNNQEAPPFTPENWNGTLKENILGDIPEYDPERENLIEYWEETDTTRTRVLEVVPLSNTELGARARRRRQDLLNETDINALGDRTLSDEMRDYRQALRDITDQEGFPTAIVWPIKPIG